MAWGRRRLRTIRPTSAVADRGLIVAAAAAALWLVWCKQRGKHGMAARVVVGASCICDTFGTVTN